MSVLDLGARRHNFQKWKIMLNQRVQESSNWSVFMKSIVENNAASNKIANSINISVIEGMIWKEEYINNFDDEQFDKLVQLDQFRETFELQSTISDQIKDKVMNSNKSFTIKELED